MKITITKAVLWIISIFILWSTGVGAETHQAAIHVNALGHQLPMWSALPFVGILLSIALMPIFVPHFWHHHFGKVSAFWSAAFAIPFLIGFGHEAWYEILHIYVLDYIPFIILLWALFTVSGGILVEGSFKGTPLTNTIILVIGTIIASWVGTTGASMLLIRPLLRANATRQYKTHVVIFFIFLVSNIGGILTPLGDPPLFLGFLHFVPFFWTLKLIGPLLVISLILLGIFFIADTIIYRFEQQNVKKDDNDNDNDNDNDDENNNSVAIIPNTPLRILGLTNVVFLAGIVGGILLSGFLRLDNIDVLGVQVPQQNILRDVILIVMGILSLTFTTTKIRTNNGFTWSPILEVAYLFAGIFMCIIPALAMLKAGSTGPLGFIISAVKTPADYFWASGALSSFLDNAPTYLTFLDTELGVFFPNMPEEESIAILIQSKEVYLMAISAGSVFMGANTYIGNAPNFMVKAIAEENGIRMPGFFGYMLYSGTILIPSFMLISYLFFST